MSRPDRRRPLRALLALPLVLLPIRAQDTAAATPLNADRVQALAQHAFAAFGPPALCIAVVQTGREPIEIALGERSAGHPVTVHSTFNIASCTKAFTAALMAQQVHAGALDWNDRVVDHVPGFRMQDPWITAHMTIADLLSHRCGLVTFAGDLLWYDSDYDDAEVLRRIEQLPIPQRFREEFGYQNLMYLVAGQVLARSTGTGWEELVEQSLLQPLGMQDSRASVQRLPQDSDRAAPHIDGHEVEEHAFVACKPAASIHASIHDLVPWIAMLLGGGRHGDAQLLDAPALAAMWQPHVGMGRGTGADARDMRGYGMGWFLYLERGKKLVEHDGGMPGFLSKVSLLPADGFGFAVLNNGNDGVLNEAIKASLLAEHQGLDGGAQIDRIAKINERILQQRRSEVERREAQRIPGTTPRLPLADYCGRYEDESYGPAEVRMDGDQLHVTLLPSKRKLLGPMLHWHQDVFRVDFPDRFLPFALFRFEFDTAGKVAGFRIDCPIADFDFGALDFRRG
ncbi:MAG: serine hydrolase [Planctomycetota bacterium]